MAASWYEAQVIEVLDPNRGGLVTYHGPGQLVAYPIVDLAPLGGHAHEYVRGLERVMIGSLARHRGRDRGAGAGAGPGGGGEEDRLDRRPRQQGGHHARAGGERRQRPAAVRV